MSRAIRRFFYVWAPGTVLHMMWGKTHSEGFTVCGRIVAPGWKWVHKADRKERVCKQCVAAAANPGGYGR